MVLEFVKAFLAQHGFSPSYEEIAAGTGASKGRVFVSVRRLCEAGEVTAVPRRARSIMPVDRAGRVEQEVARAVREFADRGGALSMPPAALRAMLLRVAS